MITTQSDTELEVQFNNARIDMQSIIFIIVLGLFALVISVLTTHGRLLYGILGLMFAGGGIFALVKLYRQQSIVRRDGATTITQTRTIGSKSSVQAYEKADIIGVFYLTTYKTAQKASFRAGSDIYLILKDKSKVLIDRQWAFPAKGIVGRGNAVEPLETEAQQIATFLSVPLQIQDLSGINPSSYL